DVKADRFAGEVSARLSAAGAWQQEREGRKHGRGSRSAHSLLPASCWPLPTMAAALSLGSRLLRAGATARLFEHAATRVCMTIRRGTLGARAGVGSLAVPTLAVAQDFYKGRTLNIVVGFTAGGGFDINARLLARYIGRHIPGNPDVVVQNMPGAASIKSV